MKLLRLDEVLNRVPVSRSTWWSWCKEGRAPKPIKLGPRTTAWLESDIDAFIQEITKSNEEAA